MPHFGNVGPKDAPHSHNSRDKAQKDHKSGTSPASPGPGTPVLHEDQGRVDPANGHSSSRPSDGLHCSESSIIKIMWKVLRVFQKLQTAHHVTRCGSA